MQTTAKQFLEMQFWKIFSVNFPKLRFNLQKIQFLNFFYEDKLFENEWKVYVFPTPAGYKLFHYISPTIFSSNKSFRHEFVQQNFFFSKAYLFSQKHCWILCDVIYSEKMTLTKALGWPLWCGNDTVLKNSTSSVMFERYWITKADTLKRGRLQSWTLSVYYWSWIRCSSAQFCWSAEGCDGAPCHLLRGSELYRSVLIRAIHAALFSRGSKSTFAFGFVSMFCNSFHKQIWKRLANKLPYEFW